jgi:hypothetical protein
MSQATVVLTFVAFGSAVAWFASATSSTLRSQMRLLVSPRGPVWLWWAPRPWRALLAGSVYLAPPLGLFGIATLVPLDQALAQVVAAVAMAWFGAGQLLAYRMPIRLFPRWLREEIAAGMTRGPAYDRWDAVWVWLFSGAALIGSVLFVFLAASEGLPAR